MKKTIATFFYGSIEKSLGPAIHFTELWNNFNRLFKEKYSVVGYASYINDNENFTDVNFNIRKVRLLKVKKIRMLILDAQLSFFLIKHRKNIIYFRLTVFNLFSAIIIKLLGIKPIVELNGIVENDLSTMGFPKLFNKISKWQSKIIIGNSLGCIAVSDAIAEHAKAKGAASVVTIKNGVASKFFDYQQSKLNEKFKVIYVGTFTPWDGAAEIVELAKSFPEVEFNLYGVGDNVLRDKIIKSAPKNVNFPGYVNYTDLPKIYAEHNAGIVLYAKKRNNEVQLSSLKTLEYLAAGLPIFTTMVRGQEFIYENNIGVCIEISNCVNEFHDFLTNYSLYKTNVESYRKKCKGDISWEGVAIKTEKFISSLI